MKMFFSSLPCPVLGDWISAHPVKICIHRAYCSRGFSAGRGVANQKQSVTKFLMGINDHNSVSLVANFNALLFFGPGFMKVILFDETDDFQHPSPSHLCFLGLERLEVTCI